MRIFLNIIWHIPFFGFVQAFFTFILGSLLVLTVVASPIGFGLIQLSKFLLAPFTRSMVDGSDIDTNQNELWKNYGLIIRIIYFPIGLLLVIITVLQIILLFITIIGIPLAIVLSKSLGTFFNPINKKCVSREEALAIEDLKMKKIMENLENSRKY